MSYIGIAIALFVGWLLLTAVFEVVGLAVHLLLVAAVLALVAYFVRKASAKA